MSTEQSFDVVLKAIAFDEAREKGPIISGFDFRDCKMWVFTTDYSGIIFENCDLRGANFAGCSFGGTQIGPDCKIDGCLVPLEAALEIMWFKTEPADTGN